jgi:antitoxin component YwqK of YwqJK toxin-antitoxin module
MIGYKAAKVGETRVVITLDIPDDAITNVARTSVLVKDTAKYRTNKAKVLKIEDDDGKEYTEAVTGFFIVKSLTYKLNDLVKVSDYDMDVEQVCSSGIHFFRTKRIAELYGRNSIENGLFQRWHDNGEKDEECTFRNGKKDGLYQRWYENGRKWVECTYRNRKLEGLYQRWYENRQKWEECRLVNGMKDGLYQSWHENGQKWEEAMYVDGVKDGLYQRWYENGETWEDCTYVDGERV